MREFPAAAASRAARWGHAALGVVVVIALAIGATVLFAPSSVAYSVDGAHLHVEAALGPFADRADVVVDRAERVTLGRGVRLRGTGRADYCAGWFRYAEIGEVWQATRCARDAVLVTGADGERVLVAPADRDAMIGALERGDRATFEAAAPPARGAGLELVAALVLLVTAPMLAWTFARARALRYRVEPGVLAVPSMLGTLEVPIAGARVWRDRAGRRAWLRVFGAGMPGLHLGRYRGEGRWLHVAATRLDDVVFVQSEGRCLVVSPEDPSAFIDALVEHGASRAA